MSQKHGFNAFKLQFQIKGTNMTDESPICKDAKKIIFTQVDPQRFVWPQALCDLSWVS